MAEQHDTTAPDFTGRWNSLHGSSMQIVQSGPLLSGTFTPGPPFGPSGEPVPLTGYAAGVILSFVVLWDSQEMTTFVGQLFAGSPSEHISSLYFLSTIDPSQHVDDLLKNVRSGSERFYPSAPPPLG